MLRVVTAWLRKSPMVEHVAQRGKRRGQEVTAFAEDALSSHSQLVRRNYWSRLPGGESNCPLFVYIRKEPKMPLLLQQGVHNRLGIPLRPNVVRQTISISNDSFAIIPDQK